MNVLVNLSKMHERILEGLVKEGFFKTKSEAIRAGILEIGKEYDMVIKPITDKRAIAKLKKIEEEIETGKRRMIPFEEIMKKYPEAFKNV